jgi:hypothetical protein
MRCFGRRVLRCGMFDIVKYSRAQSAFVCFSLFVLVNLFPLQVAPRRRQLLGYVDSSDEEEDRKPDVLTLMRQQQQSRT